MLMGKHEYSVERNIRLNDECFDSLYMLYQPLIGAKAISLYISLERLVSHTTYSNLSLYTSLDIEELERSLIMLERYRLIKTFKHESEDEYIHQLYKPISPNDFLNHFVYGLELRNAIGNHQYNLLVIEFNEKFLIKDGFKDISETKIFNHNSFNEDDLAELIKNSSGELIQSSQFKFDLFLEKATELKFPSVLRTNSNLNLIAELALIYGISEQRMATLVFRSIDYQKVELETEKLFERVRREEVEVEENINLYDLPNHIFLQNLQNGATVSKYNKELLEYLAIDMKLSRQVINRLIEHIMQTQNNRLVKNFVLQVATTWSAYAIKNVDEANELIHQQQYTASQNNVVNTQPIIKREVESKVEEFSQEELDEIDKAWKEMQKQYGESNN